MTIDFPVEQTVKARYSVRTYEQRTLPAELKEKLNRYAAVLANPFSVKVSFRLLEAVTREGGQKLGTYGMIKGASEFIGATVPDCALALEALGYDFEKLILYATHLGLGTCWLGGTFTRSAFTAAMQVKPDALFPAISPVGYPAKKRFAENLVRKVTKADSREPWSALFFNDTFNAPLTENEAGTYAFPLEMLRLAPSASNKQPWRIVRDANAFHFYEQKAPGYSDKLSVDIQRVDIGIGACHFHLAALEKDLPGRFEQLPKPAIDLPANTHYIFSWVTE